MEKTIRKYIESLKKYQDVVEELKEYFYSSDNKAIRDNGSFDIRDIQYVEIEKLCHVYDHHKGEYIGYIEKPDDSYFDNTITVRPLQTDFIHQHVISLFSKLFEDENIFFFVDKNYDTVVISIANDYQEDIHVLGNYYSPSINNFYKDGVIGNEFGALYTSMYSKKYSIIDVDGKTFEIIKSKTYNGACYSVDDGSSLGVSDKILTDLDGNVFYREWEGSSDSIRILNPDNERDIHLIIRPLNEKAICSVFVNFNDFSLEGMVNKLLLSRNNLI